MREPTRRRSRGAQAFPSEGSLTRLVGAVMCGQDDMWSEARYFSEQRISELYGDGPSPVAPSEECRRELLLIARQTIRASLELADTMGAAWDRQGSQILGDDLVPPKGAITPTF